jgi:CRP-like cAMP-binding protein
METNTLLPILKKIPVFADLNEAEHVAIINRIILNYFPVGFVFFREGDEANGSMFIIKRGIVKISRKDLFSGEDKEVSVLSNNDFFGEMALVTEAKRNATATAIAETEAFELRKDEFLKLMQTSPTMANKISTEFTAREKKNHK